MKRYIGRPADPHHDLAAEVVVVHDEADRRILTHRMHHSPGGFEWGYGGSGPSDLARSLLWDVLDREPDRALYHKFKFDFIANFTQGAPFSLDESYVWDWLQEQGVTE